MEQTKVSVMASTAKTHVARAQAQTTTQLSVIAFILFSMTVLLLASGCALFDRSGSSGYFQTGGSVRQATVESDRKAYERSEAQEELGPTSSDRAIGYRQALKRQEKMLEGKSEREQYYKAKPYLKNDAERLQFLRLESTAERDRYLNSKGINGDQITHPPEMQGLVEQNDIAIGMTRQAVKEAWGAADDIEVAGNPLYGNEKWKYSEQVTSSEGYMTERRTVFFESGRVVGWETR